MRVVAKAAVSTLTRSRKAFMSLVLAELKCGSRSSTTVIFGSADMSAVEMASPSLAHAARAKADAAADEQRRARRAPASTAGALLLVRLATTTPNLMAAGREWEIQSRRSEKR
eukprot:scaffold164_cov105-Isochrysis_galbana.AAC.6